MARQVVQYTLDGSFLATWESAAYAEVGTGIAATNILKCCKGKRMSAGGSKWGFAEGNKYKPPTKEINFHEDNIKNVDLEKGTIKSTVVTDFEAHSVEELAKLHKIDLSKYKISNYWSKLRPDGKFTSSILSSLRSLGDPVSSNDILECVKDLMESYVSPAINPVAPSENNKKAILFNIADEHIACSNDNSLFENKWDEVEYRKRKLKIIEKLAGETLKHGDFEKIIFLNLGDNMDGFNGQTTRGGHTLPQNMTNKQAIETYAKVNMEMWDYILKYFPDSEFEMYDMLNDNHSASWGAAATLVVNTYLQAKYPNRVKITQEEKIIGHFKYGKTNILYNHGKDEKYMKTPYPLNLNDATESKIKQWMDLNGIHYNKDENTLFLKGDIHKFNWNEGKFLDYINCPSMMGSTDWIMHNFGNSKPGILTIVIDRESGDYDKSIIRF